jgi:DegV family protein with EDD domain
MAITKLSITTDSTADLGEELNKEFDIKPIALGVVIGENIYSDGVDITPDMIYDAVEKQKIMPKTNAVSEEEYKKHFESGVKECGAHIHFSISGKLSVSNASAVRAAEGMKNVFVIDSLSLSTGTGVVAIMARQMANEGMPIEEIVEKCNYFASRSHVSFVLTSLKYLHKGGRVSGLKMLGANLLNLHPQLLMDGDGYLVQGKIFRGNFDNVVKQYTKHVLDTHPKMKKGMAFVTHTAIDPSLVKYVIDELRAIGVERICETVAGSTISSHCGPNTIGIAFCEE